MSDRHPDTPELEYSIALLLKVTGQPQQALDRLEPLLQENANFQPAIILKGDLLYQTGQKARPGLPADQHPPLSGQPPNGHPLRPHADK